MFKKTSLFRALLSLSLSLSFLSSSYPRQVANLGPVDVPDPRHDVLAHQQQADGFFRISNRHHLLEHELGVGVGAQGVRAQHGALLPPEGLVAGVEQGHASDVEGKRVVFFSFFFFRFSSFDLLDQAKPRRRRPLGLRAQSRDPRAPAHPKVHRHHLSFFAIFTLFITPFPFKEVEELLADALDIQQPSPVDGPGPLGEPAVGRLGPEPAAAQGGAVGRGGAGDLVALDHADLREEMKRLEGVEEGVESMMRHDGGRFFY